MDRVSPARHVLADDVTEALTKYEYNRVGAVYFPWDDDHPEMRDHFLPHCGLVLHRNFADPRMETQIHQHTMFHCFWGWPLPVNTTYGLYQNAAFVGEVLATMESEYGLFDRFPKQTEGMFNPAYPSTYQAFKAVGVETMDAAIEVALKAQFNRGIFRPEIYQHPNFKGGVAITLHRQSAWATHDEMWCNLNWKHQHDDRVQRCYRALWEPERHKSIFQRHSEKRTALGQYGANNDYDDYEHLRATLKSMLRIMALDAVEHSHFEETFSTAKGLYDKAFAREFLADELVYFIKSLPEIYENSKGDWRPMPLWKIATSLRPGRLAWEDELRMRIAAWVDVQDRRLLEGHYL